jgi:hypothetical protein
VRRVRIQGAKTLEHLFIEHVCCRDFVVNPIVNRVGSR